MGNLLHVGLDVGSTTVKIVVLDSKLNIIYENYERHFSDTKNTVCNVLEKLNKDYPNKGENRESDIYYYAVETIKLPNLENVNYTESEINKHFELINIDLNKAIDIIKENIPNQIMK